MCPPLAGSTESVLPSDAVVDNVVDPATDASVASIPTPHLNIFDPATPLGQRRFTPAGVVATPGAVALLSAHNINPLELVEHHLSGDWGDCDSDDVTLNEFALTNELRVFSVFRIADWQTQVTLSAQDRAELPTIWATTVHDRSHCCLCLPEEY